jgi:hypothetical protein
MQMMSPLKCNEISHDRDFPPHNTIFDSILILKNFGTYEDPDADYAADHKLSIEMKQLSFTFNPKASRYVHQDNTKY